MRDNKLDPSTGPIPRAEFYALVEAPHGAAAKLIRQKYDPFFGLPEGTKIEWCATFTKEVEGYGYVKAASAAEAVALAQKLQASEIEYDPGDDSKGDFSHVEVCGART